MILGRIASKWLGFYFFILLGLYIVTSVISALLAGPIWDDEIEYIGLIDQISFGKRVIVDGPDSSLDYESAIATNLEFYGIINKIGGLVFYRLAFPLLGFIGVGGDFADEFLGYVLLNKMLLILMFICILYAAYVIGADMGLSRPVAVPILLVALPVLTGHSWLNIKDIPFALGYTLFSLTLLKLAKSRFISGFQKYRAEPISRIFFWRLLVVLSAGFTAACRPAFISVALLTILLINALVMALITASWPRWFGRVFWNTFPDAFLVFATTIILIPAAWINPFDYLIKASTIHSMHPWGGCMLINGRCRSVGVSYTTLTYLKDWIMVKLPIFHQLFILISLASLVILLIAKFIPSAHSLRYQHSSINNVEKVSCAILLLQAFLIPSMAILNNSNTYDGLRHWLFVFPSLFTLIACIAHKSFSYFELHFSSFKVVRSFLLIALCIGATLPVVDMMLLSPYSYVYINEFSRQRLDHRSVDLDYWGASSREISSEINNRKWSISNILDNGSAEHVIYPRLYLPEKVFPSKESTPKLATVHKRFLSESSRLEDLTCADKFSITRRLLFSNPLNIAAVGFDCHN